MNTITLLSTPNGDIVVKYTSMVEVQMAILKNGMGNVTDEATLKANAEVEILVPDGTPKNRISELDTVRKTFGLGAIITDKEASWEKGGFGAKADWTSDEAMLHRGVDITNEEHVKAFQAVIKKGIEFSEAWAKLKAAGVVKVDGNFHVKKLKEFQVSRSKK